MIEWESRFPRALFHFPFGSMVLRMKAETRSLLDVLAVCSFISSPIHLFLHAYIGTLSALGAKDGAGGWGATDTELVIAGIQNTDSEVGAPQR